jgi:hypothetical protein
MISGRTPARRFVGLCIVALVASLVPAQLDEGQTGLPDPVPPPLPKKPPPKHAPIYEPIVDELPELAWGLPPDLLDKLQAKAKLYEAFSRQFVCDEVVRVAEYDSAGDIDKEREKRYAYILLRNPEGESLREMRQELTEEGKLRATEVEDDEPFPPAYGWVFLFSSFHAPYFAFRLIDTSWDGFDLVHVIQFKGSLRFAGGKDIRQWEGRALIDAFSLTPLEIVAEPTGQRERIEALYRNYTSSFNIMGMRTAPKPLGYRAEIEFRLRRALGKAQEAAKDTLTFPTELRYDTRRVVSPTQIVQVRASTHTYEKYRFTEVGVTPEPGETIEERN